MNRHKQLMAYGLLLSGLCLPAARAADQPVTMHLGRVTVRGEKPILKALQLIKLGLREPLSDNPKLANVVVCRMHNELGSHAVQELSCGTNANLSKRRWAFQLAGDLVIGECGDLCTAANYVSEWNVYLATQPGHVLTVRINAPAFNALLETVPLPVDHGTPATRMQQSPTE